MRRNLLQIGAVLISLFICAALGQIEFPLQFLSAVAVHEGGHILIAALLGIRMTEFRSSGLGFNIKYNFINCEILKEAAVILGGSLCGILSAALLYATPFAESKGGMSFILISLTLSALNLMPVRSLDGGELISSLLNYYMLPDRAYKITHLLSLIFSLTFWFITVCIQMRIGANLSMLMMSIYFICKSIFK